MGEDAVERGDEKQEAGADTLDSEEGEDSKAAGFVDTKKAYRLSRKAERERERDSGKGDLDLKRVSRIRFSNDHN